MSARSNANPHLNASANPLSLEEALAQVQETILTAIQSKQNVLGSFPISQPLAPLYALAALKGQFLCLVVVPDRMTIQRHLEQFQRNGIVYPQVAALDGGQPPHVERETLEHIRRKGVSIVYTVPDAFGSIHFLQRLLHLNLGCIVVEQAQFLIPGTSLYYRYNRFFTGWNAISKKPPLVMLTSPLSVKFKQKLIDNLEILPERLETLELPPSFENCTLTVRRCLTEKHKFQVLLKALQGDLIELRFPGSPLTVKHPGPTVIHTMDMRTAERMARTLQKKGFENVYVYTSALNRAECQTIERIFKHEPNTILVSAYHSGHFFKHPADYPLKNIFWNVHPGLYELMGQAFPWHQPMSQVATLLLYSKEDYSKNLNLMNTHVWEDEDLAQDDLDWTMARLKDEPLPALRRWVLSEECRFASGCAQLLNLSPDRLQSCRICDQCRTPSFGLVWDAIFKHWLY
jgi:hypothetical protein